MPNSKASSPPAPTELLRKGLDRAWQSLPIHHTLLACFPLCCHHLPAEGTADDFSRKPVWALAVLSPQAHPYPILPCSISLPPLQHRTSQRKGGSGAEAHLPSTDKDPQHSLLPSLLQPEPASSEHMQVLLLLGFCGSIPHSILGILHISPSSLAVREMS